MISRILCSCGLLILFAGRLPLLGQTNISGTAPLSLEDRGFDPSIGAHGVTLFADLTGLSGIGGPAGLNAFAVTIAWDRGNVYHSFGGGQQPALGWTIHSTDGAVIALQNHIRLAAYVADTNAPNLRYELATIYFAGNSGPLNLSLGNASLGSRVVNSDGPDAIMVDASATLTIDLAGCNSSIDPDCNGVTELGDVSILVDALLEGTGTLANDCDGDGQFGPLDVICLFNLIEPLENPGVIQTSLLDIDGSGQQGGLLTDGIMISLYMSGVTSPTALTNNLVLEGAGRMDPQSIKNYLDAVQPIFDVDLNGQISPFTDGIMIWLYLSGVTGPSLTAGLIGPNAQRTTSNEIQTYLDSLMN